MKEAQMEKAYRILGVISICAVLLLIMVGGIVRATGSGMGCPDWPKCYGQWIPPTDVSQLPADYLEKFDVHGHGLEEFNAAKTWTEYINRLIGVLIGFFVFGTAIASFAFRKKAPRIFWLSLGGFLLTVAEGGTGAMVVRLNLEGWSVTLHMFMAMVILLLLIMAVHYAFERKQESGPRVSYEAPVWVGILGMGVLALTLGQIIIGTQVRENVDEVALLMNFVSRDTWVEQLGGWFDWHRSFYILVTAVTVLWAGSLLKFFKGNRPIAIMTIGMLVGIFLEIMFGFLLVRTDISPFLQPLHLTFSSLIFALQILLLMQGYYLSRSVPMSVTSGKLETNITS